MRLAPVVTALITLIDGSGLVRKTYYGDQTILTSTPCVTVELSDFSRELSATGHRITNTFELTLMLYVASLRDQQVLREDADNLANDLVDLLDMHASLGGLVMNGFVTRVQPGYAIRGKNVITAVRITFTAQTREDRLQEV